MQLHRIDIRLARVVRPGVLIERQEIGAEPGAAAMQGEVLRLGHRIEHGELLAQHAVQIGCAGAEQFQFVFELFHDQLHHPVEIRQLPTSVVSEPVVGVPLEDETLAGCVLPDGERAGADYLGRIGVDPPKLREGTRLDRILDNVLGVDGGAH